MEDPRIWALATNLISKALKVYKKMTGRGVIGPSLEWYIESELKHSGYLTEKSQKIVGPSFESPAGVSPLRENI